ncbi:MAG: metalloregulator ArsR/SmtB family transcription factor [Bacteroidota bacterium]
MEQTKFRSDPAKLKRVARLMKTMSHQSRLAIVELLLEKKRLSVTDIYQEIGISQSNASQHLKALEMVEILTSEREGKQIFYRIQNPHIGHLLMCVGACSEC